jgi:hypothetical protein
MTQEMAPVRIEITEDATAGISIRLHNNGRFPDLLQGIPKHIVRRARPWLWNSYERRVLAKARSLTWQGRRLVRQMLIAERAKALMARNLQPKRAGWLARRLAARAAGREGASRAAATLPRHRLIAEVRNRQPSKRPARSHPPQTRIVKSQATSRLSSGGMAEQVPIEMSLAEQLIRASEAVAEPQQDQSRSGTEITREATPIRQSEGWAVKQASERSLAEEMLTTSAWTGLRARPTKREEGQERSR